MNPLATWMTITAKAMQLIEEEATQRNAAIILADLKPIEFFNAQRTLYM